MGARTPPWHELDVAIAASMKPLRLWGGLLVGIVIIVVLIVLPVNKRRLTRNQGHGRIHEAQEE
jgi:hypothetical protein